MSSPLVIPGKLIGFCSLPNLNMNQYLGWSSKLEILSYDLLSFCIKLQLPTWWLFRRSQWEVFISVWSSYRIVPCSSRLKVYCSQVLQKLLWRNLLTFMFGFKIQVNRRRCITHALGWWVVTCRRYISIWTWLQCLTLQFMIMVNRFFNVFSLFSTISGNAIIVFWAAIRTHIFLPSFSNVYDHTRCTSVFFSIPTVVILTIEKTKAGNLLLFPSLGFISSTYLI